MYGMVARLRRICCSSRREAAWAGLVHGLPSGSWMKAVVLAGFSMEGITIAWAICTKTTSARVDRSASWAVA